MTYKNDRLRAAFALAVTKIANREAKMPTYGFICTNAHEKCADRTMGERMERRLYEFNN